MTRDTVAPENRRRAAGGDAGPVSTRQRRPDDLPAPPRRLRRALVALSALVLVLGLLVGGGAWFLLHRYAGNVDRVGDVFSGLDGSARPAPATSVTDPAGTPVTVLLIGSDTRADIAPGDLPDARSDLIMLVRFTADRQHAQVVSLPRDSWVDVPGHGMDKINASYALGGPTLLIRTVEQLTGVRIDHFAAIDFQGLIDVTAALGGVDVTVAETTTNGPYTFPAGIDHLDGDQARWYVGQRHGLPGGDFDRVRRQQAYLRSMFSELSSQGVLSDVGTLDSTVRTVTSATAVDDGLGETDMATLAWSLRGLRPADVGFFTAPVLGTGTEGAASVVYLDPVTGGRMWADLRNDSLGQNAAEFADQALPAVPN